MAAAEAALHSVATVEAPLSPGQADDAAGIDGSSVMEIGHKRPRSLLELRGLAQERSVSEILLSQTGAVQFDRPAPPLSERFMNRLVRNRTHGGVGGRQG
jgi:hypothetical protein